MNDAINHPPALPMAVSVPRRSKHHPDTLAARVRTLESAGYVCIKPGTNVFKRIWLAMVGGNND